MVFDSMNLLFMKQREVLNHNAIQSIFKWIDSGMTREWFKEHDWDVDYLFASTV